MEKEMGNRVSIYLAADNIISSLGFTTQENLEAIRNYRSGITLHTDGQIADTPIQAATVDSERLSLLAAQLHLEAYSRIEQLFILSIREVLTQQNMNAPDCCIIFSTTKGNIGRLSRHTEDAPEDISLWRMAERIAEYFHAGQNFRVISNACISGVSALVVAQRLMEQEGYKHVIVTGADVLSHFITSGFLSFKSVSEQICRPFDTRRDGLNLGEGCGTLLLTNQITHNTGGNATPVMLLGGGISNDANHISGPSRTGDGLYHAICQAMTGANVEASDIDFVNTHGTATVYNDEMESKAIHLAGLQNVPVSSFKSYFGHTLGAAGIIETIICAHSLKESTLFGTFGFKESGVTKPIHVHARHIHKNAKVCVKTASGFGGCNAAIVLAVSADDPGTPKAGRKDTHNRCGNIRSTSTVTIQGSEVLVNGERIFSSEEKSFGAFIREAFRSQGESNMKFYKMDDLCKLGYMASHYLLKDKKNLGEECSATETGIVLANSNSSLHTDIRHQVLIDDEGDTAASPAVFVYTLPNVVAGEICIRYKIQGENTFFINKECNLGELKAYARLAMQSSGLKACIVGWCELLHENYNATFEWLEQEPK